MKLGLAMVVCGLANAAAAQDLRGPWCSFDGVQMTVEPGRLVFTETSSCETENQATALRGGSWRSSVECFVIEVSDGDNILHTIPDMTEFIIEADRPNKVRIAIGEGATPFILTRCEP